MKLYKQFGVFQTYLSSLYIGVRYSVVLLFSLFFRHKYKYAKNGSHYCHTIYMARLLFISDTHGSLACDPDKWDILAGQRVDAVICMGDIYRNELIEIKAIYKNIPVYGIPGNHEPMRYIGDSGISDIHGKTINIGDVTVAGFGGCIRYKDDPELCTMSDKESLEFARNIPYADILVSHSPYKRKSNNTVHSGLLGISWYLEKRMPKFHFYGHLHQKNKFLTLKSGTVSMCVYQCMVFDSITGGRSLLF